MPYVAIKSFTSGGVNYFPGDVVPPEISGKRSLRGRLIEFRATVEKKKRGRPPKNEKKPLKDAVAVSNLTVAQVKKLVAKEKSIEVLEEMLETEIKGRNRKGAAAAIEARIDKLKEK